MIKKAFFIGYIGMGLGLSSPAQAHFIEDFYHSAATQGNVTAAGIHETAGLKVVTGGGYVYKAPRNDFTPFHFSPPKLSAGCGGIDLFMGAFSIPSKEEFVNYLKAIGSSLPGLAFQLALQTLSPDLSEQVTSFRDLIREYGARFQDSCTAAQTLLDMSGAQGYMEKLKYSTANSLRERGIVSDAFEASERTKTHGGTLFDYAPTHKDTGNNVVDAPQMNLTWALLNGGTLTSRYPKELREVMMTLVGTTIYMKTGEGADAVAQSRLIMGEDIAMELLGDIDSVNLTRAHRLSCSANDPQCLAPTRVVMDDINLTYEMWQAAKRYQSALLQRNPSLVDDEDVLLLGSVSTIPLITIINTITSRRYMGFADDILRVYVEAAAFEAIVRALEQLTVDIERTVTASSASTVSSLNEKHAQNLIARVHKVRNDLTQRADKIYQQMARTHSFIEQIEHIERSLLGNAAYQMSERLSLTLGK